MSLRAAQAVFVVVGLRLLVADAILKAYQGADLDQDEDKLLVEELKSLVGSEIQWPKGEPVDTPRHWEWFSTSRQEGYHKTLVSNRSRTVARRAHVHVIEWLVTHHAENAARSDLVSRLGQRMVRLGLIPHYKQWTEVLNEQLASFPIKDLAKDEIAWPGVRSALRWLEGNFTSVILAAFRRSDQAKLYREHEEGLHLTGHWETAYVVPDPGKCEWKMFPGMCKLLTDIDSILPTRPGVKQARFARMHPGTMVKEHTADTNQRIKIHCGVVNPSRVTMHIGDTQVAWQEGRCYLVDDSYAHSIVAEADAAPRTIFEIKLLHPDLAWAQALRENGRIMKQSPYYKLARKTEL